MSTVKDHRDKQKYIDSAHVAEQKYGLPENLLIGVMGAESNFNPNATSPVGARGLMQFMPATAKQYGIDPLNPDQSIDAAGKYLASSYKQFGNWDDALMSYNMGVGGLKQVKAGKRGLPKETREYTGRVYKHAGKDYSTETSYANNVAPHLNQQTTPDNNQQQTTAVNQLQIPIISANFAGVSGAQETEKKKDEPPIKEAEEVKQQTNEYNFLKNYQEQYAQQEQQPIQIPTIDVEQTVNEVSQFVDRVAQQGGMGKKVFNPNLSKKDVAFQKWYKENTWEAEEGREYSDKLDYDFYSFYKNGDYKNPNFNKNDHFPDTYKRPTHPTFSNESIYSTPENPGGKWDGETYIPKGEFKYQQGGTKIIEDNLGYWNPKNIGKNVKIDGGDITMEGVNQPLMGRADTGETKLMLPNQKYTFAGAKNVVESPLTKEEQMFLEEYGKLQYAQQGANPLDKVLPKEAPTIESLLWTKPNLKEGEGIYYGEGDNKTFLSPSNILDEVVIKNTFRKKKTGEFKDVKIQNEALDIQKSKESTTTINPSEKEVDIDVKASEDFAKSVKQKETESLESFKKRSNELDVKDEPLKSEKDLKTSESILQVQQKLKRAGYNLNPEGKFKNYGLDGKMGKVTRQALEDFNKSGEKAKYTPYKTGEGLLGKCREEQCSEFVQNEIFRNTKPNVSRQQWNDLTGLQGDAWRIGENIINKGGKKVEGEKVKPGDTVTMYTGYAGFVSTYLPQAKKYGTDATHIGVIDKVNPDGSYYILHNVHAGSEEDGYSGREYRDLVKNGKIESESVKRNFDIRGIYRPNYEAVKDYDKKVKVRDDISININDKSFNKYFSEDAKSKAKIYTGSLNNVETKKTLASKYGLTETDYQSLAKAALGILAQESKFGTSKGLIPKQIGATASKVLGYVVPKEVFETVGMSDQLKRDEVSKGAGQLKYKTNYGDSDLTELGINKDNFTDDNNTALVVFDRLANYYKDSNSKSDKEGAIYKAVEKYNRGSNTKYADKRDTDYVNKVLSYSDLFTVKDENNIEYNTLIDKLNLNNNIIKKQKIFLNR